MPSYEIKENEISIYFEGVPSPEIRQQMKNIGIWWNPEGKCWKRECNDARLKLAKEICDNKEDVKTHVQVSDLKVKRKKIIIPENLLNYGLKIKIKDILQADDAQITQWKNSLTSYVNKIMTEDNINKNDNAVSQSQEIAWIDCFQFIRMSLVNMSEELKEYELIFEYSLPGTVHERPDVFLLTNSKVLSLEFKKKNSPQIDDNKDDVAQALRYKEYLMNHHKVTRDRGVEVKSYLVCTSEHAIEGKLRDIEILTKNNFCNIVSHELLSEDMCSFSEEWLSSPRTEMPDMLEAIDIMYTEGKIPYISDVNKKCLDMILKYIDEAKEQGKKMLILINGVPGAGKTAVGQSIVFEQNKNGQANAVYLSGNGPLVEILQYQINQIGNNKHMGANAIQGIPGFKSTYFSKENSIPQQSVLVFDEAQRAWDSKTMQREFSEPEGLFRVGERIFNDKGYVVLIALYGDKQAIYKGEEEGILLWERALQEHKDWDVVLSDTLSNNINNIGTRKIVENSMFLSVSLRADFKDCSKWVEETITRNGDQQKAKIELEKLQKTSMRICITRKMDTVKNRMQTINKEHPDWKYGCLISNFAEPDVIKKAISGWDITYNGLNVVKKDHYGEWFSGNCNKLDKACTVYGNQGLELDCPIIIFGGDYIRKNGKWICNGKEFNNKKHHYDDPDTIVENNLRVLLTRARKEMVFLIPEDPILDETYQYFVDMGIDIL